MKKLLLILTLVLSSTAMFAQDPNINVGRPLPLIIKKPHQGGSLKPFPKSPVEIPEVYLDENVLSFDEAIEGCLVQLVDEDEDVVFADFIDENQTTLTLPSTLTGTYELQIITDSYIFYCEIEL